MEAVSLGSRVVLDKAAPDKVGEMAMVGILSDVCLCVRVERGGENRELAKDARGFGFELAVAKVEGRFDANGHAHLAKLGEALALVTKLIGVLVGGKVERDGKEASGGVDSEGKVTAEMANVVGDEGRDSQCHADQ